MNRFDERYNFRLAVKDDIEKIMQFIHDEWNANHILAQDRELFEWQYGRTEYGDYENINFVLMEEKNGDLSGIIGFIVYSNEKERLHISQAITKVKANGMMPMVGIELMRRQMQLVREKITFSYGTNPNTIKPLWERCFHSEVGIMQQFYMINDKYDVYKIADIQEKYLVMLNASDYSIESIDSLEGINFDFSKDYYRLPYKSKEYIDKRYFKHPVYKYKKWIVKNQSGIVEALLFGREICMEDRKLLRIVDYRGELDILYQIGQELYRLVVNNDYEYVDIMTSGLDQSKMRDNGFNVLDSDGKNIIPNYFEPFERRNVSVYYQKSTDVVIFKADGDQDRPNRR